MNKHQHQGDKLEKQIRLLETELAAIKGSRSYRMARTAGVFKSKLRENPAGLTKKMLKTVMTDPRRLVRLAKGGEHNTGVAAVINNRLADYHRWIALQEPNGEELEAQRKASAAFTKKPLISILTPVFDPPVDVLAELIDSVLAQTYPYMELCLGNFGKSDSVKRLLDDYAERDSRVKVYEFAENLGIGGNSNLLLEKVQGEFVALLDHDDTISPDALYENARMLNETDYDFIYSDKDMMDEQGNRYEPLLKADSSPETMLNANYFTHFDVMRTSIVRSVGAWDSDTDGAQDWDLFLKIMNVTDKIAHLPKVLYHWRVIATSTALSIDTKPYALAGQRRAVQKYLDSQGIDATPYHYQTELLLEWKDKAVDPRPRAFVHMHTVANTLKLLGQLRKHLPAQASLAVIYSGDLSDNDERMLRRQGATEFLHYEAGGFARFLRGLKRDLVDSDYDTFLFADDRVRLPHGFTYRDFAGWLSIVGVGAVAPKVVDGEGLTMDLGGVLTDTGVVPIFQGYPAYYQTYMGNSEWVRNMHAISQAFFVCSRTALAKTTLEASWDDEAAKLGLLIAIGRNQRLVTAPKSVVTTDVDPYEGMDQTSLLPLIENVLKDEPVPGVDRYGNPNLHPEDPMRLNTDQLVEDSTPSQAPYNEYQHDALILSRTFDLTEEEINWNVEHAKKSKPLTNPKSAGFFLPSFDAIYAGLVNIFSFAEYLADQGLAVHFFILKGTPSAQSEKDLVAAKFPGLKKAVFTVVTPDNISAVPKLDIGVCTQWSSAYTLAKCRNITRKCYFIQDNEPNFYPLGSVSALADLTYRLGFFGIANTEGLLTMYKQKYGGKGTMLKSLVSMEAYHPREDRYYKPTSPYRVFFYARPNMPRNAFELGLAGLTKLKEQLGDKVQIIAAGAAWDPAQYGVAGVVENLGKIPYDKVPDLYRSVDAGVMFMFSGHPGVTASELMASGCPTVVNQYDDVSWHELYQHEKTCLVSIPTASEIARNIRRCLEDDTLRRALVDGGLQKAHDFYEGYEPSRIRAFEDVKKG
jgi:glycosyltransferase involved in cell wall biosynthesis